MNAIKGTARFTGVLYLLMGLPAPLNLIYLPSAFIVRGDAAATARNITSAELTYRLCVLSGLFSNIFFLFLVLSLYQLLRNVDRKQAMLMVVLVSVSVAIGVVNLLNQVAPLILLSGAKSLSAFTEPQLDALAMSFLRLNSSGNGVASAFWGLWLLPFGILVMKSGFIPRIIGILLIVGCIGYLIQSFTSIVYPAHVSFVFNATMPLVAPGELSIMIWLLVKGGKVPLPEWRPSTA